MEELITIDSVVKKYASTYALKGVSIKLPRKGMVFIQGKSGCGKTTLLNLLGGLDNPTEGSIVFDSKDTIDFSLDEWDDYRNRLVGFIFQDYNLLDGFSVGENIELALDIQSELINKEDKKQCVRDNLRFVGLEGFENRAVNELSGGQKQRVAIARAIAKHCEVILADEPTGNLDRENSKIVLELLKKVSETHLVVIVTHDVMAACEYGDRIITISDGTIVDDIQMENTDNLQLYSVEVKDKEGRVLFKVNKEKIDVAKQKMSNWLFSRIGEHVFSINVDKTNCVEYTDSTNYKKIPGDIKSKKMSLNKLINIAMQNLLQKKGRLACTMIMVSLTMFLLLIISFVLSYKPATTITSYIVSQKISKVYLGKDEGYENLFFDNISNNIRKGEEYYSEISCLFPGAKLVPRYYIDTILYEKANGFLVMANDITLLITDEFNDLGITLDSGRCPIYDDEIVITDYVAKCLLKDENILGRELRFDNFCAVKVVGIIKTDYIEKEIPLKVNYNMLNEFENCDMKNVYQIALTNSNFINRVCDYKNAIDIPSSDFTISDKEQRYIETAMTFGTVNSVDDELLFGRMPREDNEVLISSVLAEKEKITEENIGIEYGFRDIYDQYFGKTYFDRMNLYDSFPNGVKIVGVYDENLVDAEDVGDTLFSDKVFRNMLEKYTKYYMIDDYMLIIDDCDIKEFVNVVERKEYTFDEPAIQRIHSFYEVLDYLKIIIVFVFSVITIITIAMLYSYINNNINVNSRKIGVLKAIGITTKQISSIFLIESVFVSVTSFALSCAIAKIFIYIINNIMVRQTEGHYFEYVYWNTGISVLVALFALMLCMCSVVFPIYKLARKKPVDIIYKL